MRKEIINKVQETQTVPVRINPTRSTPRHTVIKLTTVKDRHKILKTTREKQQTTRILIRLSADFSAETLQARREWHDILKVLKGKSLQQILL